MMLDEQGGYQGERQEHGEQSHQASSGTSSCGHYDWSDGGPVSIRDDDVLSVLLSGAREPLRWPDWLKVISIVTVFIITTSLFFISIIFSIIVRSSPNSS